MVYLTTNTITVSLGTLKKLDPTSWKVKEVTTSHVANTFLRASSQEDWYFDNGYSRNMTGENNYLKELKPYSNNYVTFGDGLMGKVSQQVS